MTEKIDKILARKRQVEKLDLTPDLRRADEYIAQLEGSRDLSQHVVHVDCDAFYAAVEQLDRPELKDIPFAVGKGVLTTCNYHARKFGCRSGMAGFVAMKLCPQLICLPLNFDKYTSKAQEVRAILAEYDPRFESSSIDEAYLNITQYCQDHQQGPEEVVEQMRAEVHEKTKITVSAGIAANARLAKICSNKNKPNGQFRVANDRSVIMAFMRILPTRKINGIGRVWERELDAVGVKTCGDIYAYRAFIPRLFGEKAYHFLMSVYLGLGKTDIHPSDEYERKSVGTESTFHDMSDKEELRAKLRHTAEELEKDSVRVQSKGRVLVLKIKLSTYEVFTRQMQPPMAIYKADDLYKYAVPMLAKLEKEIQGMTLRLMGLRLTHLVSTMKEDVDFFGLGKLSYVVGRSNGSTENTFNDNEGGWEVWPETEFEEAARKEREDEMNEVEALSQRYEQEQSKIDHTTPARRHGKEILANPIPSTQPPPSKDMIEDEVWACPICARPQAANDRAFNEHIDLCLSRQTIADAVKDTTHEAVGGVGKPETANNGKAASRKRSRQASRGPSESSGSVQKKLFFS